MENNFNYFSLDECIDQDLVFEKLDKLQDDGKISYSVDSEIVKLEDLDLEEKDIKELEQLFYNNDVYPYIDLDDDDEDDFDYEDEDEDGDY
jgi:hypothetical protein